MRRTALGLATALVGGLLAVPGAAHAGTIPTYNTLAKGNTVSSGSSTWTVSSCSAGSVNCALLAMMGDGNGGITIGGAAKTSGGPLASLSSVLAPTAGSAGDVTLLLTDTSSSLGFWSISTAGTPDGGSLSVNGVLLTPYGSANLANTGKQVVHPITGGVSELVYSIDIPVNSSGPTTVTLGAPPKNVPEPASAGLLAIALLGLGFVRRRSAR